MTRRWLTAPRITTQQRILALISDGCTLKMSVYGSVFLDNPKGKKIPVKRATLDRMEDRGLVRQSGRDPSGNAIYELTP